MFLAPAAAAVSWCQCQRGRSNGINPSTLTCSPVTFRLFLCRSSAWTPNLWRRRLAATKTFTSWPLKSHQSQPPIICTRLSMQLCLKITMLLEFTPNLSFNLVYSHRLQPICSHRLKSVQMCKKPTPVFCRKNETRPEDESPITFLFGFQMISAERNVFSK